MRARSREELRALGRTDAALLQYRRALDIWQVKLGPSYETAVALSNIAQAELDSGRNGDALRDFQRGPEFPDKALGPQHAECGANSAGLGKAHRLLGKLDLARDDFQRALKILETAYGAKSAKLVPALLGLGRVDIARHNAAAATVPLERALALREAEPDDGVELAEVRLALAEALGSGNRPRAVALATQARDVFVKGGARLAPLLAEANAWLAGHH